MGIRLDPEAVDAQGLPVVSWEEDRNLYAPGGARRARVACFIRPNADGVLQFVSAGLVREGDFEEERPWQRLVSFAETRADQHYWSASQKAMHEMLTSRSKSGAAGALLTDGAMVMVATFNDDRTSIGMHLNCADASPVEMAKLTDRLVRAFLSRREDLVNDVCNGDFVWPKDKPFIAYEPPALSVMTSWVPWAANAIAILIVGLVGWGLYWLLAR